MAKTGRGKQVAPPAPGGCTETARSTGRQCRNSALEFSDRCRAHPRQDVALTAASVKMGINGAGWKNWRWGDQAWQMEAWRMYDIIGELRKYANWIGAAVSKCRLYVAEIDENGEPTKEVDDPRIASLAADPLGKGPAKDEALRLLGTNLAVVGEAYIVAEADAGEGGDDLWYVVSGSELQQSGNRVVVNRPAMAGLGGEFYYDDDGPDLLIRCWTPHPRRSMWADSSVRAAIPVLRKIETVMKRSFAELDSRLTGAGLLVLPQNLDFPRGDGVPEGIDGFAQTLTTTAMTSIEDRASAPAMVPLVVTVPPDSVDKIKFITFWSELSDKIQEMEDASIKRLAGTLDIPLEVLTGMGDASHWNAWAIAEDTVRIFIEPVLQRIAEALDHGYLNGILEAEGLDPAKYTYAFDTAPLTVKPDRGPQALALNAAGLLSDEETLKANNYAEEHKQLPAERVRHMLEQAIPAKPELLADPLILCLLGLDEAEVKKMCKIAESLAPPPPPPQPVPGQETPALPAAPAKEERTNERIPRQEPSTNPATTQRPQARATASLWPMANFAMIRALGVAGSRLVSHRERDRWPGTDKHALHVRYGAVTRDRAEKVLAGVWADLRAASGGEFDADRLEQVLHETSVDLLMRGIAYEPGDLQELIERTAPHLVPTLAGTR